MALGEIEGGGWRRERGERERERESIKGETKEKVDRLVKLHRRERERAYKGRSKGES